MFCDMMKFVLLVLIRFCFVNVVQCCENFEGCRGQSFSQQTLYCFGDLSCADTLITDNCCGSTYDQTCSADHSCDNTVWRNASWFSTVGALSMYNATVYNSGIDMSGWVRGYYALYNATFYCYNSSSCSISCNGNSCVNFNLICDDTSTCSISGTRTYEVIDGAPDYYRGGLPMVDAISESSIVSDAFNGGIYCNLSSNAGSPCKETVMTIDESYYNIYCRASDSCRYSNVSVTSNSQNSGIYCSAAVSCQYTHLIVNEPDSNNNNTVYCGADSCSSATIAGFNKIYAMGYRSMKDATIISNGNNNIMNVYFASYDAGSTATIYCNFGDTCNIYCDAYQSCYQTTAHCYGTCNVYCDIGINDGCITVNNYSQSTTSEPTLSTISEETFPETIATTIATATTTTTAAAVTRSTVQQSASTTTEMGMTGIGQTTENTRDDDNNDNNNNNNNGDDGGDDDNLSSQTESSELGDWSKTWEIGGYVCLVISLAAPIVIVILAHLYHKNQKFQYCDKPNYFAIFACFWNFGDFYSDLIFTFVLITTNNTLWYFAVFFALIPHFVSNFVSLYNISKWQKYNIYIAKYINRYDSLIIFVSVLAGFYTSIELARSKLFYWNMFSMQLKNEDYAQLQKFRFFNTVLFENIPQFVIQIIYTYETGSLDIFVLSAMIFSILSAMISISEQLKRKMKHDASAAERLHYRAKKTFKMKIVSSTIKSHHKYCHNTLTKALCSALGIDNAGNIEVFYVINIRNGIMAYVQVSNIIVDSELCDTGLEDDKATLFEKMKKIDEMDGGSSSSNVNRMLKEEIVERLHLSESKKELVEGIEEPGCEDDTGAARVVSNMEIRIEIEKAGLSVDTDAVKIKSKKSIDSSYNKNETIGTKRIRSSSQTPEPPRAELDNNSNNNNNNNNNIMMQQLQLQPWELQQQMQQLQQQMQQFQQMNTNMNMNMNQMPNN